MPKFRTGQTLYYLNPFVFIIDIVNIDFLLEEDNGQLFYIDDTGAYLLEQDLFLYLDDAKQEALRRLKIFYQNKQHEILHREPTFDNGDNYANGIGEVE